MRAHDPLCPAASAPLTLQCACVLIARVVERERSAMDAFEASVRADERAKVLDWRFGVEARAAVAEEIAQAHEGQILAGLERGWSFAALKAFEICAGEARRIGGVSE